VVVGCGVTGFFRAVMHVCRLVRGTEITRTNGREEDRIKEGIWSSERRGKYEGTVRYGNWICCGSIAPHVLKLRL
jgi:hypothetical protein